MKNHVIKKKSTKKSSLSGGGFIPYDPNKSIINPPLLRDHPKQASLPKELKGYWPLIEACRLPQEVGISVTFHGGNDPKKSREAWEFNDPNMGI